MRCWRSCLRIFLSASRIKGECFWLRLGFSGEETEARAAEVVAFWLPVGKNEGRIVLQFAGIETISDAETVAGLDVLVPREERLPLDDESVYISELVGCTVYDGATAVGVVEDVQFAMTADGARRLADAAPSAGGEVAWGDEILIPFVKAFLVAVDTEAKRIEMKLPEGLVEVNRRARVMRPAKVRSDRPLLRRGSGKKGNFFRSSLRLSISCLRLSVLEFLTKLKHRPWCMRCH